MSLFGGSTFGAARPSTFGGGATTTQQSAQDKDIEVSQPPTDGVSALSWSPVADFLAVSSWDNNVSIARA